MKPKIHRFLERFKSPEDWLYNLICTRQGSNLQPYDPKSHTLSIFGPNGPTARDCGTKSDTDPNSISHGRVAFHERVDRLSVDEANPTLCSLL